MKEVQRKGVLPILGAAMELAGYHMELWWEVLSKTGWGGRWKLSTQDYQEWFGAHISLRVMLCVHLEKEPILLL